MKIRFLIESIHTDRAQYKPYSYELNPASPLYLEVEVADNLVTTEQQESLFIEGKMIDTHILSLHGFTVLLDTIATPLKQMDNNAKRKEAGL